MHRGKMSITHHAGRCIVARHHGRRFVLRHTAEPIALLHWQDFAKLSLLNFDQDRCRMGAIFLSCGPSMTFVR